MIETWGVLGNNGQWIEYKVSEEVARKAYKANKKSWRLVKNIETHDDDYEDYSIVSERKGITI